MVLKRKKYLAYKVPKQWKSGKIPTPRIPPARIKPKASLKDLVELYAASGSFQAGRLATGCSIYKRMMSEDAGIALTLAGAMTPTGMGGLIAQMIEHGAIDWIISTGANVFHDLHFALGFPLHQGDFKVNDCALHNQNIDRIYDIFLTEETMLRTDIYMIEAVSQAKGRKLSTAQLHNIIGKALLEDGFDYRKSMVAAAAKFGVPIYTSSPGDSEVGMDLAYARKAGIHIELDPIQDVIETCAIVNGLNKNGVVIAGGGSPKNFYLQTQPMLRTQYNIDKQGHDFDIQVTIDSPHWGGLSGATPDEAVSWGKIKPGELKHSVVIYSDSTIALPILFGYVLQTCPRRKSKRLFEKTPELLDKLNRNLSTDVLGF